MSLEGALRPEDGASPASAPAPPHASFDVTLSLLRQFYSHVKPLQELFPPDFQLLREGDSDAFRELVEETMVASLAEEGVGELRVESLVGPDVGMRDILEQVHTRLFSQHARLVTKVKKSSGAYISATPKNVLALGYRPATGWNNDAVSSAAGAIPLVNVFANTTVSALRSSREWHTLLARIGPHPLLTLLSSSTTALFTPLANACLLQVSGTPVSELKPRYILDEEIRRKQKKPRKRINRAGKRKRRKKDTLHDDDDSTEEREATVEATPPPSPPPPTIRTPNQSPIKRIRTLGPSVSAPELLSPGRTLGAQSRALVFPATQAGDRTALRPTQSSTSLLGGGVKRRAELEMGVKLKRKKLETLWSPNEVVLTRHRLYHARPSRLSPRKLAYGLPPKHILFRIPTIFPHASSAPASSTPADQASARHLAKYIFPRQFSLHNVFTSPKAHNTFELLPDYDDRELDIKKLGPVKTPKRLKGVLGSLEKMIKLHSRCKPRKLLDRHCPSKTKEALTLTPQDQSSLLDLMSQPRTQMSGADASIDVSHRSLVIRHGAEEAEAQVKAKPRFVEYTCSAYEVESYVKSVIREVVPRAFWGSQANADLVLGYVSSFLRLRRFESMTVHTFLQKFCIADCAWLLPASASHSRNAEQRPNELEMAKRRELLQEFLFWLVDGFVIPLVRTAFYITDSATHQNRALFFRQDDWDRLCSPLLRTLGQTIFERIPDVQVNDVLQGRQLGFSYVRLLPKATGVRPIVNLGRRPLIFGPTGRREVGKPINKILQSAFDVLTFERKRKPELVGSLVANPQEIYARLKTFKQSLPVSGDGKLLYFVKVDVRAAYDTIKQEKLLEIVEAVLTENDYWVQRYVQVTPALAKANKKFKRQACPDEELGLFSKLAAGLADELHNAVLSDQVVYLGANRDEVMNLLREHITTNLVKIGPRLFRQKDGIPQGSVLSSLLCSLFYGDMEMHKLGFTKDEQSLLLRYVDDFLFVSTQRPLASRFLRVMDEGHPDYGCYISTEKRLTNFDLALHSDELVVPLAKGADFPWCGLAIDTQTLDVKAGTATHLETEISDKLTVQRHKKPGHAFINTMLRAIKLRSHVIYNDTSHNSVFTVYLNIYRSILVVALKFQAYVREWGADPKKRPSFFLRAIKDIVKYAFSQAQTRAETRGARELAAECDVRRSWVLWLGYHAFHRVLGRKPAAYAVVLYSLAEELRKPRGKKMTEQLSKVVKEEGNSFAEKASSRRDRRFL